MSMINISNLTFSYDGSYDTIFDNVSLQLDTDWKLGFVGRNGRGKTTFLRLLMGQYAYTGSISASVEFEYFPLAIDDEQQYPVDIAEDMGCETWQLLKELSHLDVADDIPYRPFATLSNGEKTKVMLAILFARPNRFLLIDEPTNHLDLLGREVVATYLSRKKGFILVSHDRVFLDRCVDHVLSINRADIEIQQGNFSSWQQNRAYQDQFEADENEKIKREVKHLTQAARQTASWSDKIESSKIGSHSPDRGFVGHKAAKMMARSKATEKRRQAALEEKSKLLKNVEEAEDLKIHPLTHHAKQLVSAQDVRICYGDTLAVPSASFTLAGGERVALAGRNGAGKSTLLKAIVGVLDGADVQGTLSLASGLIVSYVPQSTDGISGRLADFARAHGLDEPLFFAILRKLAFERTQFEKNIDDFSEGQKKKVWIAKSLCEQAHVYVWDEPLNYIDVLSRMQIERLIAQNQPTMLLVEHDAAFLQNIGARTVEL